MADTNIKKQWESTLIFRHGKDAQKAFSEACVAVCGLGGLGSAVATLLARCGIGKLLLIDFDRVEISNIHRQQYKLSQRGMFKTDALFENLKEINPFITVEKHNARLIESNAAQLLKDANIVAEAFDNAESKALLANIVLESMGEKYLVASSGMAGFGNPNAIRTEKITENFYLCGDRESDINTEKTLVSTRVMICAAHQAHAVITILRKDA